MKIGDWLWALFVIIGTALAPSNYTETAHAQKVKVSEAIDVTGATNSTTGWGHLTMSSGVTIITPQDPFSQFQDPSQEVGCNGLEMEIFYSPSLSGKGFWTPATCSQIMKLLSESRDVRSVTLSDPPRRSLLPRLLYPQERSRFTLTAAEWKLLQDKAAVELKKYGDYAQADVVAHWKSIVAGKVPFGLQVEK